jgi:hypothetical protein
LNALRIYDFLKQAGHHPEVASIRLNAGLNHPLSADHIEMQLVACLICEGLDKKPLRFPIPLTEGMQRIDLGEQAGRFARKLDWLDSAQQVRAVERVKYSLCLVFQ